MKKMFSLLSALFVVLSCQGTQPDPTPEPAKASLQFAVSPLTLDPQGGEASVKVTASGTWGVSTDGQAWYSVSSASQIYSGESLLKVTAQPNNTASARQATLSFQCGDQKASLTLSQGLFVPELTFSAAEAVGEGIGGEVSVTTATNAVWTVVDEDID